MKSQRYWSKNLILICIVFVVAIVLNGFPASAIAAISGECSNCHTMHNSQSASAMATYGASGQPWKGTGPYESLTRGDCLGCHGSGSVNAKGLDPLTGAPQVYHDGSGGAPDLAGGNFAYILGTKGSLVASDAKGHNVIDLGDAESTLTSPPPGHHAPSTLTLNVPGGNFTCSGLTGCHGRRSSGVTMKGAHHQNVNGQLNTADQVYNSYRFLMGVKGLENTVTKWQNVDASDHNEYFGAITPMTFSGNCSICHTPQGVQPTNDTMSGFCGTCHRSFHVTDGIGGTSSPFERHPTDIILPNSGEYAGYNGVGNPYSVEAPVARTSVPASPGNTVSPGNDVVMCLSCHKAHATDYPDMLRWDYTTMIAGAGGSGGCFTCHTNKN